MQGSSPGIGAQEIEIVGQHLVGYSPMVLPDVCPRCGESHKPGKRLHKKIYWSPKWIFITFFISPVVYVVVMLFMRKKLAISYFRCDECTKKVHSYGALSIACFISLFMVFLITIKTEIVALLALCIPLFVLGALFLVKLSPLLAQSYDNGIFTVKGAHQDFLDKMHAALPSVFD